MSKLYKSIPIIVRIENKLSTYAVTNSRKPFIVGCVYTRNDYEIIATAKIIVYLPRKQL